MSCDKESYTCQFMQTFMKRFAETEAPLITFVKNISQ